MRLLLDSHVVFWTMVDDPSLSSTALPFHHKDPFDRLLVAQALVEVIPLISSDRQLDAYGVRRIW